MVLVKEMPWNILVNEDDFKMKRKDFLAKGIVGLGATLGITALFSSKKKEESSLIDCEVSPRETRGPFPNKTPQDYVRENIIGDRTGIPMAIQLTILDTKKACQPLTNAWVDVWHCDNHGNYSVYGGRGWQKNDMTQKHFLRGRQRTNTKGEVSFISIFPGFYRGRAPHIHVEVLDESENSIMATQVAFPEPICNTVYETENYDGLNYVSNTSDGIFRNSLEQNMVDTLEGNLTNGYTLKKKIIV